MAERILTVAEAWPDHDDHDVRYVVYGAVSHRLLRVFLDGEGSGPDLYDEPEIIHVNETEVSCRTCGVELQWPTGTERPCAHCGWWISMDPTTEVWVHVETDSERCHGNSAEVATPFDYEPAERWPDDGNRGSL